MWPIWGWNIVLGLRTLFLATPPGPARPPLLPPPPPVTWGTVAALLSAVGCGYLLCLFCVRAAARVCNRREASGRVRASCASQCSCQTPRDPLGSLCSSTSLSTTLLENCVQIQWFGRKCLRLLNRIWICGLVVVRMENITPSHFNGRFLHLLTWGLVTSAQLVCGLLRRHLRVQSILPLKTIIKVYDVFRESGQSIGDCKSSINFFSNILML